MDISTTFGPGQQKFLPWAPNLRRPHSDSPSAAPILSRKSTGSWGYIYLKFASPLLLAPTLSTWDRRKPNPNGPGPVSRICMSSLSRVDHAVGVHSLKPKRWLQHGWLQHGWLQVMHKASMCGPECPRIFVSGLSHCGMKLGVRRERCHK